MLTLPATPAEFQGALNAFRAQLEDTRRTLAPPQPGWYPFHSFTGLEIGLNLAEPFYPEFARSVNSKAVADIGCGDGDLALLFSHWGAEVDALDYPPTNYNQMQGVERLAQHLALPVGRHRVNLDGRFDFPRHYGLALFLGALYHLQNPYYVLERLAFHADWCLLSTRIAQRTVTGVRIADEPLAYLASGIEINNDSTNYWIFSLPGLLRLVQRTRWAVRGVHHAGCLADSNPSEAAADERAYLLLQSRVTFNGLQVRPGDGWYDSEGFGFCWTAKRFTLHLVLPLERSFTDFSLQIYIPEAVLPSATVNCFIRGESCAAAVFMDEGIQSFRGSLPPSALHDPDLVLEFRVESAFVDTHRDLGICVPIENGAVPLGVF